MPPTTNLPYEVIDSDGHVRLPGEDWWKPYLPKRYWDWAPALVTKTDGSKHRYAEGRLLPPPLPLPVKSMAGSTSVGGFMVPGGWRLENPESVSVAEARRLGGAVPKDRLAAMDKDDIAIAYLYPSELLSLPYVLSSSAFALAIQRAHNDWLADYCNADPHRLRGVALVPQQDLVLATEEMQRVRKKDMHAVMLRPNPIAGQNIDHRNYERVWSAAEHLHSAVGLHEGFGLTVPRAGVERCHNFFQGHVVSHPVEHMLAALALITGGVFQRHPKLRLGFMESGAGWAPFWLNRMDEHHEKLHRFYPEMEEKPSVTFRRQCFLGIEPDDHLLPHLIDFGLGDALLFSSDFPHFDAAYPGSVAALAGRTDLADNTKRKALRDNALRFYGVKR